MTGYSIPNRARIGHVHMQSQDLDKVRRFYVDLLGFNVSQESPGVIFLAAGDYHHHLAFNTWHSRGQIKAGQQGRQQIGLYHIAINYPHREDLAAVLLRIKSHGYPIAGAADHGVSEAIYLSDMEGNGIELTWDKPREEWPSQMKTDSLDLNELIDLALDAKKKARE